MAAGSDASTLQRLGDGYKACWFSYVAVEISLDAALQNAQFEFPSRKITVNLAPADLRKESGRFDLPIALGVLAATGQLPAEPLARHEFAGELALTGELRPIRGALPMALSAQRDGRAFVLPQASAGEAALA